jgi:hypothetical protein
LHPTFLPLACCRYLGGCLHLRSAPRNCFVLCKYIMCFLAAELEHTPRVKDIIKLLSGVHEIVSCLLWISLVITTSVTKLHYAKL